MAVFVFYVSEKNISAGIKLLEVFLLPAFCYYYAFVVSLTCTFGSLFIKTNDRIEKSI